MVAVVAVVGGGGGVDVDMAVDCHIIVSWQLLLKWLWLLL